MSEKFQLANNSFLSGNTLKPKQVDMLTLLLVSPKTIQKKSEWHPDQNPWPLGLQSRKQGIPIIRNMKGDIRINLPLLKNRDTGPHEKIQVKEGRRRQGLLIPWQKTSLVNAPTRLEEDHTQKQKLDSLTTGHGNSNTSTFSLKTGGRKQKQWKLFQWKEVRTV